MTRAAKWRVVLGALMVLALIGGPVGLVGAKPEPHSDEATARSSAKSSGVESSEDSDVESSEEEGASETTAEDESSTEGGNDSETDSSAEAGGSAFESNESTSGTDTGSSSRKSRTAQTNDDPGNPPQVECGTDTFVKFGIGGGGEIGGVEFNNPPFDNPVVTLTVVDAEARIYAYENTETGSYTIFRIVLKGGQDSTNIENPPQSGTIDAPQNISHITFCLTETPPPPPPAEISVDLVKDNDADEDETFTDSEEASEEGQDVTFQVVITNTSDVAVKILSLTDAFGETKIDPLECLTEGGANVIGMVLAAGASVTCTFTVQDYAPPAGGSLTDTVEVTVGEEGNEENKASDSDTSVVTTPEAPPPPPPAEITVAVVKTNDADEDGTFTDSEEASEEGQDVTFKVVITNTSDVAVEILDLTDAFAEFEFGHPELSCLSGGVTVVGKVLAAGESVTCTFTIMTYAPPAEASLTDTVEVTVGEEGNEENQASDSDTSVVTTAEVFGGIVTPPRPGVQPPTQPGAPVPGAGALAVTGAEVALMLLLAAALLLGGAVLIYATRERRRERRA